MSTIKDFKKLLFNFLTKPHSEKGRYRFVIKSWDKISDIDLATEVVGTDFFKSILKISPVPLDKFKSYLVIAPHQDDETIGAGGTLLLASKYNPKIDILYITGRMPGKEENKDEEVVINEIRNAEAAKVAAELNADMHHLGISNFIVKATKDDVKNLATIIKDLKPEVIMIPWLLDPPAKHRMANHLLYLANEIYKLPDTEVWGYQVHNNIVPNNYVDITSVMEDKIRLLRYFESQNNGLQRYDHIAKGMAIWNGRFINSTEERYYEMFFSVPLKEYCRLIKQFYFKDIRKTYNGFKTAFEGMEQLHKSLKI